MALPIKDNVPGWLEGSGEHADVILSSRIRLARNLKGYPFSSKIRSEDSPLDDPDRPQEADSV